MISALLTEVRWLRPVLLANVLYLFGVSTAEAQSEGAVPVTASTVIEREVGAGRTFVGTVEPLRASTIGSAVEERLIEFPVAEGDRVEAGQILAILRTTTLEIELEGAKAELEARRQELAEMENGSRPEEIEQAKAQLGESEALRSLTQSQRSRMQDLFRRNQASVEELDQATSAAEQAVQAVRRSQAELDLVLKGPREEKIAQTRARLDAQQQAVNLLEDRLAEHTIRAPFDGFIVSELTQVGQWVGKGDPIVELIELDYIDINTNILEDYVRYVGRGTPARIEVSALPDEAFTGEVALVVPQADVRSRTFPVKVRVENRESAGGVLLKSGMIARVTLPVGEIRNSFLVHKDALVLGGASPQVIVIDPESSNPALVLGRVRVVDVRLGVASGSMIAVDGPLKAGQKVVVQGNERLRPGQLIRIIRTLEATSSEDQASASIQ